MPTKIVPIQMPLNGLNSVDPTLDFEAGYARELTNFSILNGNLVPRPAVVQAEGTDNTSTRILWFDVSTGNPYGIVPTGDIVDLTSGSVVGTIGGTTFGFQNCGPIEVKHASLSLVIGIDAPRLAAYPFTSAGFSLPSGVTSSQINAACSHKGRLYCSTGGYIEYSDLNQITGTLLGFNDYTRFLETQTVIRLFSFTVESGNESADNVVLVIFGNAGKVLIYQGDYPASGTWKLVGNYNMPVPTSNLGFVEVDGDIFVSTTKYAYWLSDLANGGSQNAYNNSPSKAIENLWATLNYTIDNTAGRQPGCYYIQNLNFSNLDCIVCSTRQARGDDDPLHGICDYTDTAFSHVTVSSLVYFRKYKAWALWLSAYFDTPTRNQLGTIYFPLFSSGLGTFDDTTLIDMSDGVHAHEIEASFKTPYSSPFTGRNQQSVGLRPIFKGEATGYFHRLAAIYDFSDTLLPFSLYAQENSGEEQPPQQFSGYSQAPEVNPTGFEGPAVYKPYVPVGGSGGSLSYQFIMKQSADGSSGDIHELFAANGYVTDGGDLT